MDWPFNPPGTDPPVINNSSEWMRMTGLAPIATSAVWSSANIGIATMVRVLRKMTVKKLYCFNGGVVNGNCCIGLYQRRGALSGLADRLITSGSVAQAGVSQWQEFNTTDTVIGPGVYWLTYQLDNITGQVTRLAALVGHTYLGNVLIASGGFPLANPDLLSPSSGSWAVPLLAMGGIA